MRLQVRDFQIVQGIVHRAFWRERLSSLHEIWRENVRCRAVHFGGKDCRRCAHFGRENARCRAVNFGGKETATALLMATNSVRILQWRNNLIRKTNKFPHTFWVENDITIFKWTSLLHFSYIPSVVSGHINLVKSYLLGYMQSLIYIFFRQLPLKPSTFKPNP